MKEETDLVIMGDLNALSAERNDFIHGGNIIPVLEEYEDFLNDDVIERKSCDKQIRFGVTRIL